MNRCVVKEEYNETSGIMTGGTIAGGIFLLVTDDKGKIHKLAYEITSGDSFENVSLKRTSHVEFKTNFNEIQFVSILPPHLTPGIIFFYLFEFY